MIIDERGNSIWEWQTDTGSFKRDISAQELERLRNAGLSVAAIPETSPGFDPYDHGCIAPAPPAEIATNPPRKRDLRKLSEEIKQGKIVPKYRR